MPLSANYEKQNDQLVVQGFEWVGQRRIALVYIRPASSLDALSSADRHYGRKLAGSPPNRLDIKVPPGYQLSMVDVFVQYCDEGGNPIANDCHKLDSVFLGFYQIRCEVQRTLISSFLAHVRLTISCDKALEAGMLRYRVGERWYPVREALSAEVPVALNGFEIPLDVGDVDLAMREGIDNQYYHVTY